MNGMDDSLMLGRGDTNPEEEMELLEDWLTMDTSDEYCMDFTNTFQYNFTNLYEELKFLEKTIAAQKVHIQHANLELKGERVVLNHIKVDNAAKYDQRFLKGVFEL
jgi:hypothetical protein